MRGGDVVVVVVVMVVVLVVDVVMMVVVMMAVVMVVVGVGVVKVMVVVIVIVVVVIVVNVMVNIVVVIVAIVTIITTPISPSGASPSFLSPTAYPIARRWTSTSKLLIILAPALAPTSALTSQTRIRKVPITTAEHQNCRWIILPSTATDVEASNSNSTSYSRAAR